MGARETALNALMACRREGAWTNGVLKEYIARDGLDRREAALCARLTYGVVQNRGLLDFYLQQLLTGKVRDLHPAVRDILHLGLYQLLCMDRIPESAAVNASVDLAKKYCRKQRFAPGLVNAVLRKGAQQKETLAQPDTLAVKYSHPAPLVALLRSYVGEEKLEGMLRANNETPATVVQVNTLRTNPENLAVRLEAEGVSAHPHIWMENCLVLSGTGDLERLESFREGLFYVQDPAAKLSVLCAKLFPGAKVLDCCAAPGGKSFAAAMEMGGKGSIFCCDVHSHKTGLIRSGADRLGLGLIEVFQQDATVDVPAWHEQMDAVLADVPCSGYGIIRKKPDIRYKDPDSMQELPGLQFRILRNQARFVKPGGVLMYSTCTLVRRENEGVVDKFLKINPDFFPEKLELPSIFPKNETGMLRLIPGENDTDGFFICRLRRKA